MGVFFNGKAQFSSQCLVIFKKKKSYFLCLLISLVAWTFTPRFVCQLVRSWLILSLQHLHKAKYSLFGLKYLMKYFYFHLFILFFILPVKSFLSLPQSFSGLCFSFQRLKILEVNTFKTKVKKKLLFSHWIVSLQRTTLYIWQLHVKSSSSSSCNSHLTFEIYLWL